MPLIAYKCKCGHLISKYERQVANIPAFLTCPFCKTDTLKKMLSAPSNSSKISVDNGFQARAVEIDPNIIEMNEARSNKNYTEE